MRLLLDTNSHKLTLISSDTKFPFYRKQGLKLIENYLRTLGKDKNPCLFLGRLGNVLYFCNREEIIGYNIMAKRRGLPMDE